MIVNRGDFFFGDILKFVAEVGTAIRMNSPYNELAKRNDKKDLAVMHLSDALHNLSFLSQAMVKNDNDEIAKEAQKQADYWKRHLAIMDEASKINSPDGRAMVSVQSGIGALERMARFYNETK